MNDACGSSKDDAATWKDRYSAALVERKRQLEEARDVEQRLLRALLRLTMATAGADPALDSHLKELRDTLRKGTATGELLERIDQLSDTLLRAAKDRGARRLGEWTALFDYLERFPRTLDQARRIQTVRQQAAEPDHDRDALLTALAEAYANTPPAQPEQATADQAPPSKGIRGLFGKRETAVPASSGAAATLRTVLLGMLDELILPKPLTQRGQVLRQRVENAVHDDEWADILSTLANLFVDLREIHEQEKREIEAFLAQVTDQLQQLDRDLEEASSEHRAAADDERRLEAAVQADVKGMEDSVAGAMEFVQLKRSIQERLTTLRTHMDARRQANDQHTRRTEQRIQELTERLQFMEERTQELQQRIHEARDQALRDPLTGIANRLAYEERAEQELARWGRSGEPLSLLLWDIDHFKKINDKHGHTAGDKALTVIARILSRQIRGTDFIARYGGEEFVMLLPNTNRPGALTVANKIRESIRALGFHHNGRPVPITISCGISELCDGEGVDQVLARADQALYQAKRAGRNRCVVS